jgi:MFS family permease
LPPAGPRGLSGNVWKLCLYQLLFNLGLWWPIWVLYLQEVRGLTLAQVGALEIPFWLTIALTQVPAAALADRWGRRPVLVMAALTQAAAVAFFGLADSFTLLVLSYLVWGASYGMAWGPDAAFLYDTLRATGRTAQYARLMGLAMACNTAGMVLGTFIGAPVAAAIDLRAPIFLSSGLALAAAAVAMGFREPLAAFRHEMSASLLATARDGLRTVLASPPLALAIALLAAATVANLGPVLFVQPFLAGHGVEVGETGLWQTPMRLVGMAGALAAYRLAGLLGLPRGVALLIAVGGAAYGVLALWDSLYAAGGFFALAFVFAASRPLLTDYINGRVSSGQRATVASLGTLAGALVFAPAAPVLGHLADVSFGLAAGVLACLLGGGGLCLLLLWRYAEARGRPARPMPAQVPQGPAPG